MRFSRARADRTRTWAQSLRALGPPHHRSRSAAVRSTRAAHAKARSCPIREWRCDASCSSPPPKSLHRCCIQPSAGPWRNCSIICAPPRPTSQSVAPLQSDTASQIAAALADKHGLRLLNNGHIPPIDSPSLTLSWAIEFLRQQAQLLARHNWPESSPGAISPFWIEDVLALGDVLWPDALDNTWKGLSPTVVPPKLLVMLSEPSLPQDDQSLLHRLAVAVRIRASRKGMGPVLWLESR